MAEYKPETCAYCASDTWCETRANGKPQCRACKVERFFENVLYPPLNLRLLAWQRKVIRDLYGTVELATGLRQYRRAFISVAKKNGKSFLVGGLPIYHLLMENERTPKAFGAAAAKDQAGLVFDAAKQLVGANPELKNRLRIVDSTKHIIRRDGGGFYRVLSADGDIQDGIEPSLALIDELHRWKTAKALTLYDVITKGTISRSEPLIVEITTAGEKHESPIWTKERQFARHVMDGSLKSDRFYPAIWEADEKRIASEPEYWKSRESRLAANPSHEDFGGFLRDEAIVEELDKALADPSDRPKYLRYHLNVGVDSDEERAIDMFRWVEGQGDVDLREWPEYDVELLIRKWGLIEKPCFVGVDASWTTDLTAISVVFPPEGADKIWKLLLFFWMPSELVAERQRKDRVNYGSWVHAKFIEATPGSSVDQDYLRRRLRWASEMFEVREILYDPWNFRESANILAKEGLEMIEVGQKYANLSEPTKKLFELYLNRQLLHGNNPVLNYNAACLSTQGDKKDNVQPSKPERGKSSKRIDGISATVTAMCRAISVVSTGPSVYESRGVLVL